MFPLGTDRPQRHVPWMNILLITANVVVFLLTHHLSGAPRGMNPTATSAGWAVYELHADSSMRLYQFFTYQFLHEGWMHLIGNMIFLYVFGNNLNEKLGHASFLALYLTGGVLAGCGQVMFSAAPTLGASGAISAVAGAFLVLLPRTNVRIFIFLFYYLDVIEVPSMWFILFNFGKDLIFPYLDPSSSVAHAAHLTGNIAGFAIGLLLLGTHLVQRDHYDLLALLARWRRRRQYEHLVAHGYDPFLNQPHGTGPGAERPGGLRGIMTGPAPKPVPVDPRVGPLRDAVASLLRDHQVPAAAEKYLELRQIDSRQILAAADQLDVANQLMSNGRYEAAAAAYEDYLRVYPQEHQADQIRLILGISYARYLHQPQRAIELLRQVLPGLHDRSQKAMAEAELERLNDKKTMNGER